MKNVFSHTVIAAILVMTVSQAIARPPTYTQEFNPDGTVTTTASDNSGVVHDQTHEQGQQTKQDLERQGYEVHVKSLRFDALMRPSPNTNCDDFTAEGCQTERPNGCEVTLTCEGGNPHRCAYISLCVPTRFFE